MPAWPSGRPPAPSRKHQKIEGVIFARMWNYFNNNCEVYYFPFDIRLTKNVRLKDEEFETIVQPDIVVVCDTSILDDRSCKGAPDLVVEVLSLSSLKKNFNEKFNLDEENGIKEYWLVHPEMLTV